MGIKRRLFSSRNFRKNNGTSSATTSITNKDNMSTDMKKANMMTLNEATTSQQSYNSMKGAALATLTTLLVGGAVGVGVMSYNEAHKDEAKPLEAIVTEHDIDYFFVNTVNSEDFICLKSFSGVEGEEGEDDSIDDKDDVEKINYDIADHSESIIIKTKDNHYVVIDTGNNNPNAVGNLFHQLQILQNTDTPTIDYLILSHHHSDHCGGLIALAEEPFKGKLTIKNYVDKYDENESGTFKKLVKNVDPNANLIKIDETTDDSLKVDQYLTLYFANRTNIWRNKTCKVKYSTLSFSAANNKTLGYIQALTFKVANEGENESNIKEVFVYVDRDEYTNGTYMYHYEEVIRDDNGKITNYPSSNKSNKYYAIYKDGNDNCGRNANSYGIVAINSNNQPVAYIANDLENNGYDLMPTDGIFGSGYGVLYSIDGLPDFKITGIDNNFGEFTGGKMIDNYEQYIVAAESNAATEIANKFSSNLGNIKLYLAAHHGYNNSVDAISKLNINNSQVVSIYTFRIPPNKKKNFQLHKAYYGTLSNTQAMNLGDSSEGIHCYIDNMANCHNYGYNEEINLLVRQDSRVFSTDCQKDNR